MTTLTVRRDDDDTLHLVGDAPDLIYIADEMLKSRGGGITASASNVTIHTTPPLHYRIVGRSYRPAHMQHRVWIAENVGGAA